MVLNYDSARDTLDVLSLEETIKYYATKYYTGESEISDDQFDSLVDHLREISPESEILTATGWGYSPNEVSGTKFKHTVNMGSIHLKPRSTTDIPDDFMKKPTRVSAKLDGISMALYYTAGKLVYAVTRGDGQLGIDVTSKVSLVNGIPSDLRTGFTGVIRGECLITMSDWASYKQVVPDAKDPRNSASGIINADDSPYKNYVTFVAYKVLACNQQVSKIDEVSILLSHLGFKVVPHELTQRLATRNEDLQEYLSALYMEYQKEYPCDGLVITQADVLDSSELIYSEIAYKFNGETATTTVTGVSWNLTRTQKLVPTVLIKTVNLSGADISRASGFNARYIKTNRVGIDATVRIIRSGEVIPFIQEVISGTDPDIPTTCPSCGSDLSWINTDLVCTNKSCLNLGKSSLFTWITNVVHVDGLGRALIEQFIEDNGITSVEDLYNRSEETPRSFILPNTPSARQKIISMINSLFDEPIDAREALCGLNIPRLGWASAEKIINGELIYHLIAMDTGDYDSEDLRKAVGNATYESIKSNYHKLQLLRRLNIRFRPIASSTTQSKGDVVITGALSMKRSEFEKIVKAAGYTPSGSVKKDTKYLITNDKNGNSSKNRKASELGISKVTEYEFMSIIGR